MTFVALVPRNYVTPFMQGAVGDGSTDDTTALQNALAMLGSTGGGILFIPPGFTFVTSGLDTSAFAGNLIITGGGWNSVLKLKNGANGYIIKNTNTGGTQGNLITNLKLDCNSANQTAASGGINGYKYRRSQIDFVQIVNPWQAGILLTGDSGDFGFQNKITNNEIIGGFNTTSGTNAYGEALRLINTDENQVYGNHFEANGNPNDGTFGFHIYDQNGLTTYADNSFVNGMGCIKLDGLQCRVANNTFDGNGQACVQINGSASDTIVEGNTILNPGFRASGGTNNSVNAFYVNATRCIVKHNSFQAAAGSFPFTKSFINIDTGATYSKFEDNEFNVPAGAGTLAGPITFVSGLPTGSRVRNSGGFDFVNSRAAFLTENHGSASITSGNTSIVVTHGLAMTPTLEQISVTPQTTLGSATFFWIDTVTSTQFTIHLNVNPVATVTFGWIAQTGW